MKQCLWIKTKSGGVFLIGKIQRNIMESAKQIIIIPKNPICNVCGKSAKIYFMKQWWCSLDSKIGLFNTNGYCSKGNKNDKLPKV